MALSTYSDLKTAVADFLNRDDLTAIVPTFISLAEAQIDRDVRHWRMESRSAITLNSEYVNLPSDWIETISLSAGNTKPIRLASRQAISSKRVGNEDVSGTPYLYAHAAGQIELFPTPHESYAGEIHYYAKIGALSNANTSNWLLLNYPDAYLYGSLIHSAPYLQEDERSGIWAQLYSAAVQKINQSSESSKMSGSGLTMKIRGLG